MTGSITTLIPLVRTPDKTSGGYGFLRDEDGRDRFFHARDVATGDSFEALKEGTRVEFEPTSGNRSRNGGGNGLRAERVRVIA